MLKRIIVAWHWMMARQDYLKRGPDAALRRLARIETLRPLGYFGLAYKAWLLFHSGRTVEADRLFDEVERRLAEPNNADERYVQLFCRFYGRFRVGTIDEADAIWTAAQEQGCSPMLRRYLPFHRKPSVVQADPRNADLPTSPVSHRHHRRKS